MRQSEPTFSQEHSIDTQVGERVRALRRAARLSQTELGQTIGVSFQQIQKYENGTNRISASRLFMISRCLAVPISALIADDVGSDGAADDNADARLIRAWRMIDPAHQAAILALLENLAAAPTHKRPQKTRASAVRLAP